MLNINSFRTWKIFIPGILIYTAFFYSCEKNSDEDMGTYLVSYQEKLNFTVEEVQSSLYIAHLAYPSIDSILPDTKYGVTVYSIVYQTEILGEKIRASGIVCIPEAEESFPILSFQNGTNTCLSNAPSVNMSNQLYTLVELMSGNGYVIVIPDYIGFGESDQILHPYLNAQSSNQAVTDMIRATLELLDKKGIKATCNNNLYLMGYSQGGWATLSALKEIETNPIEEMSTIAASCGAGPYNLMDMSSYIMDLTEYKNPFYFPYFIESHRRIGLINEPLSLYFKEPYSNTIPGLFDGSLCNSEMNSSLTTVIADLFTPELIQNFETSADFTSLREQLTLNSITPWNLKTKLVLFHSTGDQTIPYQQSVDMYNSLLKQGVASDLMSLRIIENDTIDHEDAVIDWGISTVSWFNSLR